jgi:hypothetical protein
MPIIVGNLTTGTVKKSDRLKIPAGTSDPTTNLATGDFYYNSSTQKYRVYNGTTWGDA